MSPARAAFDAGFGPGPRLGLVEGDEQPLIIDFNGQQLVIHFDEPKPWPWTESSNASKAALAGDMQLLKDYFLDRADIPQQPGNRRMRARGLDGTGRRVRGGECPRAQSSPRRRTWRSNQRNHNQIRRMVEIQCKLSAEAGPQVAPKGPVGL